MIKKHPQRQETWEPVPRRADGADNIDLNSLPDIMHGLDPDVGVGPRAFRADYAIKLFAGAMTCPESTAASGVFTELGKAYLDCTMPDWARTYLAAGLLTPLNKNPSPMA
jgi:hypothetical protein